MWGRSRRNAGRVHVVTVCAPRARGLPWSSSTPRWPTRDSRSGRYPVAETMASGRTIVPPCRCTAPPSNRSIGGTTRIRRDRTARHEAVIENRHGPGPQELSEAIARRRRQAEIGEVRDREPAQYGGHGVHQSFRCTLQGNADQLARNAQRVTPNDVRRCPDRQVDLSADVGKLQRDFRSRVAGADDQHLLAAVRR